MTKAQLDRNKILALLAEADTQWFNNHSSQFNYREHLEFVADYIAKNYDRQSKHVTSSNMRRR